MNLYASVLAVILTWITFAKGEKKELNVAKLNALLQQVDEAWRGNTAKKPGENFQKMKMCARTYAKNSKACNLPMFGVMCFNYCAFKGHRLAFPCTDRGGVSWCDQSTDFETLLTQKARDKQQAMVIIKATLDNCYKTAICTPKPGKGLLDVTLVTAKHRTRGPPQGGTVRPRPVAKKLPNKTTVSPLPRTVRPRPTARKLPNRSSTGPPHRTVKPLPVVTKLPNRSSTTSSTPKAAVVFPARWATSMRPPGPPPTPGPPEAVWPKWGGSVTFFPATTVYTEPPPTTKITGATTTTSRPTTTTTPADSSLIGPSDAMNARPRPQLTRSLPNAGPPYKPLEIRPSAAVPWAPRWPPRRRLRPTTGRPHTTPQTTPVGREDTVLNVKTSWFSTKFTPGRWFNSVHLFTG